MPLINRIGGGGGIATKLNIFVQDSEPAVKSGLWVKATVNNPQKIVFDEDPYDANAWIANPGVPTYSGKLRGSFVVSDGVSLFGAGGVVGGSSAFGAVEKFTPTTGTYSQLASDAHLAVGGLTAVVVNGFIYCFGGSVVSNGTIMGYATKIEIATGTVTELTSLPSARTLLSVATDDTDIYIFGGSTSSATQTTAWKYTVSTGTYQTLASLPNAEEYQSTIAIGDYIYLFYNSTAYKYSISANNYTAITGHSGLYISNTILIGSKFYLFKSGGSKSSFVFDPETSTYTQNADSQYSHDGYGKIQDKIYGIFGDAYDGNYTVPPVEVMSLTPKQYPDDPTLVLYWLPKDTTYRIDNMIENKKAPSWPTYFKDALLFSGGQLLYPPLYVGNGTSWAQFK